MVNIYSCPEMKADQQLVNLQDCVRSELDEEVKVQARSEAGSVEGGEAGGETDKEGVQ